MEGLGTSGPIIPRASMTYPILGLSFKVPNINYTHYGTSDFCENLRLGCKIRARVLQRFFLGGGGKGGGWHWKIISSFLSLLYSSFLEIQAIQ